MAWRWPVTVKPRAQRARLRPPGALNENVRQRLRALRQVPARPYDTLKTGDAGLRPSAGTPYFVVFPRDILLRNVWKIIPCAESLPAGR
ncbi:hypothetical protein KCP74_14070 [Salmonella enterica subsp. enterica]|nr:hypothetical protein KCP74_14070 [Salmonella enterica subsp. enterica]